jgi:hydrogenase maturation protease
MAAPDDDTARRPKAADPRRPGAERRSAPQPDARSRIRGRRVVIGVGNPDRGDDGAGREVARRLRSHGAPSDEVRECTGDATALMAAWAGFEDVVLVDACRGAGLPGSVHLFDPEAAERNAILRHASTHSFGVAAALSLSRVLGTLPDRLIIYGIEARDAGPGAGLTPEVERAVERVVSLVLASKAAKRMSASG